MDNWTPEKPEISKKITVGDVLGDSLEDAYLNFDITEIQELVGRLQNTNVPDLAHAEYLQQQALRCADILSEYIAKLVKTIHYLDSEVSRVKNQTALNYTPKDGTRMSIELRKMAGEASQEVNDLQIKVARAKGSKVILDKKYEIIIKSHHHYKDIASGLRRTMLGYSVPVADPDKDNR